ncbi:MAG: hypothetical protein JJE30_02545 [Desulfuromonadales bacterium]|nr:hypothetical protein [Desulfuromonadales bacterium]
MKGLLNLLAKANLVELSDEEKVEAGIENLDMPSSDQVDVPPDPPEPPPLQNVFPPGSTIIENRPIEDIYAATGLPQSPFPAEKLLRLLEGLRTMDAVTRKAAVQAMDAADDNWQISDCVDDAKRKIDTLNSYKQLLDVQLQAAEQQSVAQVEDIRSGLEKSTSEIRKQISELEKLLEREISKSAQQTTAIEAGVRAARETVGRESRRIGTEIERLGEITAQFVAE